MKTGALFTAVFVVFLIIVIVVNSGDSGYQINIKFAAFAGLAPVAWTLAGVLQAVTGMPFDEMSDRWDGMKGWQRGLIGMSVFVLGLTIVLGLAIVVVLFLL